MSTAVRVHTAELEIRTGNHIRAIDGVRGLAIGAVLLVHSFPRLTSNNLAFTTLDTVASAGPFGVDLFFVLSGFLITGILLDNIGKPNYFRNFYGRRILRLFPLYFAYLFLVMSIVPAVHHVFHISMPDYAGSWWWYLTYCANWKPNFAAGDPQLGHFWSLAVEEQFYIVWPVVVLMAGRRYLFWICVFLILSANLLRGVWAAEGVYWNQIYRLTVTRWDTIAAGSLAALALRSSFRNAAVAMAPLLILTGGLGFILIATWSGGPEWSRIPIQTFGAASASVCFAGLVLYAATRSTGILHRFLQRPMLLSLGRYSYCIYVIHVLVITHMDWIGAFVVKRAPSSISDPIRLLVAVSADLIVLQLSRWSWVYVETPILRLKRNFA